MAKQLKYMGEFLSRASVAWRVEILEEAERPFDRVGNLTFEADEPLTIEWGDTPKSQSVCSSSATLRIESPADRTFTDLYTIAPGRVRLDVYRAGQLYWSGTLDPEFYEEPYERARNYPVSLTFSDFGILDRLKYELTGLQSLLDILTDALERSGIRYNGVDYQSYCSTAFNDPDGLTPATIDRLSLRSDNFIDEDGEPMTLRDVIEGMLLPLGLRMIQRCGVIYVYDLNGLFLNAAAKEIYWTGDSQTLSVDSVYNNVKITFSPYAEEMPLSTEIEYTGPYSADKVNPHTFIDYEKEGINFFSFSTDYSQENKPQGIYGDWDNIHFTLFLSRDEGTGLAYLNPQARYAHILPMVNGPSETDCIAWRVVAGHASLKYEPETCHSLLNDVTPFTGDVLMKSPKAFIPTLSPGARSKFYLRLTLPMLLDMRYNPFTSADNNNESGYTDDLKANSAWIFIPVGINLYAPDGTIYHYENRKRTISATQGSLSYAMRGGEWVEGAAVFGRCWLEYYDPSDKIKGSTAATQWAENRQNIGRPDDGDRDDGKGRVATAGLRFFQDHNRKFRIYESFKQMPAGEFIFYPPKGGMIEVIVYTGVRGFAWNEYETENNNFDAGWETPEAPPPGDNLGWTPTYANKWVDKKIYDHIRWMLYKAPNLEIVKNNLIFDKAELDDVEYSGELNQDAKEELSMNTICGTIKDVSPTARGTYYRTDDGMQVCELSRAGVTDQAENLLIGTLYSQYADRRTSLSGENAIDFQGLNAYSEANQEPQARFLMVQDSQDAITDTSESTFIEFLPDNYKPKKD